MCTDKPMLCYLEVVMRYDLAHLHKGYCIVPVQIPEQLGFRVCVFVPNLMNESLQDDGDRYLASADDAIYAGMKLIEADIAAMQTTEAQEAC